MIEGKIEDFMKNIDTDYVYNEFSLQHELGYFFRKSFDEQNLKVQFERNIRDFLSKEEVPWEPRKELKKHLKNKYHKTETDISIFSDIKNPQYFIELKYKLQKNAATSDAMFDCIKDIAFLEKLISRFPQSKGYLLIMTDNPSFYNDKDANSENGTYEYFRRNRPLKIEGICRKSDKQTIELKHDYKPFEWKDIKCDFKYCLINIKKIKI